MIDNFECQAIAPHSVSLSLSLSLSFFFFSFFLPNNSLLQHSLASGQPSLLFYCVNVWAHATSRNWCITSTTLLYIIYICTFFLSVSLSCSFFVYKSTKNKQYRRCVCVLVGAIILYLKNSQEPILRTREISDTHRNAMWFCE